MTMPSPVLTLALISLFMLTYLTVPDATSTLSGISDWFNPFFAEFYPWILIVVGLGIVGALLAWIVHAVRNMFHH